MPKLNSNEEDADRKRKSPSNANILPQQPSIKQEEIPEPGSPQVHLPSTNSLNHHHLYTVSNESLFFKLELFEDVIAVINSELLSLIYVTHKKIFALHNLQINFREYFSPR